MSCGVFVLPPSSFVVVTTTHLQPSRMSKVLVHRSSIIVKATLPSFSPSLSGLLHSSSSPAASAISMTMLNYSRQAPNSAFGARCIRRLSTSPSESKDEKGESTPPPRRGLLRRVFGLESKFEYVLEKSKLIPSATTRRFAAKTAGG